MAFILPSVASLALRKSLRMKGRSADPGAVGEDSC